MFGGAAISTSTSSMSRWPSSPGIAMRPHGTRASRALGDTNSAALGEETESTSNCQASGAIRCDSQRARDRQFRCGRGEGALGDRTFERVAPGLAIYRIRQRAGQLVQCSAQRRLLDHPGHRLGRLPDHAQAGVGGDSDVGESQDQGGGFGRPSRPRRPCRATGGHVAAVPFGGQRAIASQDRSGVRVHLQRRQRAQPRQRPRLHPTATHPRRPGRTRRRSPAAPRRSRCPSSRRSRRPARR